MKTVTYTRDTEASFLKTTTNEEGGSFTRKIEKGNAEYSNACAVFHGSNIEIAVGNQVVNNYY